MNGMSEKAGQGSRLPISVRHGVRRLGPSPRVPTLLSLFFSALLLLSSVNAQEPKPEPQKPESPKTAAIPIAELKRDAPVDFEKEILPLFKNNCLACHNQTKAKADLVLETPETILKGGENGPAVVPGKSAESLLLKVAAHQTKPTMPPRDNKVNAADFTPEQLALLKLWIDQGAKGEVRGLGPIEWQPLPEGLNPIYAVALTRNGRFAACGRANQIFVYHVPSGQLITRLTDPQLTSTNNQGKSGVAHRDLVHSLVFSPDGDLLASGGYREVKLWRRAKQMPKLNLASAASNAVSAVAVSPDGKWLATGGADSSITLWDPAGGKWLKVLAGHEKLITALKFSPDSTKLLSGSEDKTIRVWNVAEGVLFALARTPAEVNAVTWIAEAKQAASGGGDHVIRLWQLPAAAGGEMTAVKELKGHEGPVTGLDTLPPSGAQILSGSADGTIRQWNVENGEVVRTLQHGGPVAAVAVRRDGQRFASAGLNHVTKLWNAQKGELIAELKGDRYAQELVAENERDVAFASSEIAYWTNAIQSAENQHKTQAERVTKATEALTAADKTVGEKQKSVAATLESKAAAEKALADLNAEIQKVTDNFQAAEKAAKQSSVEAKLAMEKAAQLKVTADQAAQTKLESERISSAASAVAAKTKSATDPGAPAQKAADGTNSVAQRIAADAAAVAQSAKTFADGVAADAATKAKVAAEAQAVAEQAIDDVAAKAFAAGQLKPSFDKLTAEAPERRKQATEKITAAAKAVTDAEAELKKAELAKTNADNELQLSRNAAKQALDGLTGAKASLQASEAQRKQAEAALQTAQKSSTASEKPVRTIAFSPDNMSLAAAGDDQAIHTWSAENGSAFETYRGHTGTVHAVAFAGAGLLVSGAADQSARVWDLDSRWTLERVIGTGDASSLLIDRVNALRFSPDGQRLATGSGEPSRSSEVKIWNLGDGSLVQEFKNVHSDTVLALDFSADGKYLASGAADKFVKVLDVAKAKIVKSFEGHTHHVLGVSWKRDGRTLASAGADNAIKVWDFVTGERKKTIEGFGKEVTAISFISGADMAVACSGDQQVRAVKENGENIRTYTGATDYLHSMAITPDGQLVIAGGQDSVLRVWNGTNTQTSIAFAAPR